MFFSEVRELIIEMKNKDVAQDIFPFNEINFKNLEKELINTDVTPFGITKLSPIIQFQPMQDHTQQLSLVSIISRNLNSQIIGRIPNDFSLRPLKTFKLTDEIKRIRGYSNRNWLLTIFENQIRYKLPNGMWPWLSLGDKYGVSRAIRPLLIIPGLEKKDGRIVNDWEKSNSLYVREGKINYYPISQKEFFREYEAIKED